jgi:hypothetical protein
MEGRFLEATFQRTERKLAGPGRPGTVDSLVVGGALGGAAPSLGRARCLAARGGYVNPASKGCLTQHPWRLPPLHPSRRSREGNSKPRTHCAARMRKAGCLKFEFELARSATLTSPRLRGEVEAGAQRRLRVRGTLRTLDSWRVPLTRMSSSMPSDLSPQAGRGKEERRFEYRPGTNRDGGSTATNVAWTQHSPNI